MVSGPSTSPRTSSRASPCSRTCGCAPTCPRSTRSRPRSAATSRSRSTSIPAAASTSRARPRRRLLNEIAGVSCVEPRGALYCFPQAGPGGLPDQGRRAVRHRPAPRQEDPGHPRHRLQLVRARPLPPGHPPRPRHPHRGDRPHRGLPGHPALSRSRIVRRRSAACRAPLGCNSSWTIRLRQDRRGLRWPRGTQDRAADAGPPRRSCPGGCGECVFWELDPVRRDAVRGHEAEEKAAWVSMVLREWGSCGRVGRGRRRGGGPHDLGAAGARARRRTGSPPRR